MLTTAFDGHHPDFADPVRQGFHDKTRVAFEFGRFILQPGRQRLLENGAPIRIGSRSLEILAVLVERPGELIGKRELVSRVWPEVFVEDANLKTNIVGLRRVLGDDPAEPHYIATVIGRGYRFIADVQMLKFPCSAVEPHDGQRPSDSLAEPHAPSGLDRGPAGGNRASIDRKSRGASR